MELYLTVTPDGIKEYPFHSHDVYEIIYYVNGEGYLHTTERDYPFKEGTVIIVPPHVKHRSLSKVGFKNICVHTDDVMLDERDVISFFDNAERDGAVLVKMLMRAYFNDMDKKSALTLNLYNAYRETLYNICGDKEDVLLDRIKHEFTVNIGNADYSPLTSLENKGYTGDHLRVLFKKKYQKTPTSYFTGLKISYAKTLFDAYGGKLKINEIASMCGYSDALYFSKTFKKLTGLSPKEYVKSKGKE